MWSKMIAILLTLMLTMGLSACSSQEEPQFAVTAEGHSATGGVTSGFVEDTLPEETEKQEPTGNPKPVSQEREEPEEQMPRQTAPEAEKRQPMKPAEVQLRETEPAAEEIQPKETEPAAEEVQPKETEPAAEEVQPEETEPAAEEIQPEETEEPIKAVVTSEALAGIKAGFLQYVNAERASKGVGALQENSALNSAAQVRSVEIQGCWSHTRPDGTPFYTAVDGQAYPYIVIGENVGVSAYLGHKEFTQKDLFIGTEEQIAMASRSLYELFRYSPPHYENLIKSDFQNCGIGIAYFIEEETGMPMFTVSQIFGAV